MIALIAGTHLHAKKWAKAQSLRDDEWFYVSDLFEILKHKNFHTIVVSEGIDNLSNDQLNRLLVASWNQGRVKR